MAAINPGPIQQYPSQQNPNAPQQQTPQQVINPGPIQAKPLDSTQPTAQTQTQPAAPQDAPQKPTWAEGSDSIPALTAKAVTNAAQQIQSAANTTQEATGKVYKVGSNGQAPEGLSAGDQVVTGGGTYTILAVNPDGTYRTQLTNKDQTTENYTGSYNSLTTPTGKYYKVGEDGKAPEGLSVGDYVVTGGGTYIIDSVDRDGNYTSTLVDANTGLGNFRGKYEYAPNYEFSAPERMRNLLTQWQTAAQQQAVNQIDYTVETGVDELNRALEDAQPQFQEQRNKNDIDAARAQDNSAMYAEARGDRGGIGQAQYNEIQAAAMKNRQAINTAQTKLATDTARQIIDLRKKGEFEKADKLLEVGQSYLSQLLSMEQWIANYEVDQQQMANELEQWEKNYQLSLMNYDLNKANITGYMPDGTPTRAAIESDRDRAQQLTLALLQLGYLPSGSLAPYATNASTQFLARSLATYNTNQANGTAGGTGGADSTTTTVSGGTGSSNTGSTAAAPSYTAGSTGYTAYTGSSGTSGSTGSTKSGSSGSTKSGSSGSTKSGSSGSTKSGSTSGTSGSKSGSSSSGTSKSGSSGTSKSGTGRTGKKPPVQRGRTL